jgi:hypothetical protein
MLACAGCGHPHKKPSDDLTFFQTPTVTPAAPLDGQTFTLAWRVFDADYYTGKHIDNVAWTVSRDGVAGFASGVVPVLDSRTPVDLSLTDTQTAGTHVYVITVDPGDTTPEANERNNSVTTTITVFAPPPPPVTTG